jgi:hypothetical protein
MNPEADKLYNLLPALFRVRDAEQGEPLKALCAVIAEQIAVLREDLEQLYDDQFIETCAEWVAPYIGDLIGYRPIHGVTLRTLSARAEVANTIAYRRRKGTATMLEQLARDVTGWPARVVEFFQWLETSQYMNHVRPRNAATPDLRNWEALERRDTAFNTIAHSVDMRRIETQKGRYNIPNVGLFLWRLEAFPLTDSPAFRVDDERFLFSPLGNDLQLFTRPQSETDITHLTEPTNVPEPISRRVMHSDLSRYYGDQLSVFVTADGMDTSSDAIRICNLADDGASWAHLPVSKISIDPVLGRIAFPPGVPPQNVRVNFHHGFSMAMGGGEYERRASFAIDSDADVEIAQGDTIQTAFNSVAGGGAVEIQDSGRYEETPTLAPDPAARVELRAANEHRPAWILSGDLDITLNAGTELTLNGLLLTGGTLRVAPGSGTGTRLLRLRHCTLVPGLGLTRDGEPLSPGLPSLVVEAPETTVEIDHSIVGAIQTIDTVDVKLTSAIVDATAATRVAFSHPDGVAAGGVLTSNNSTIIGKVHAKRLDLASNTIFFAALALPDTWAHPVISEQNQQGCVRFSFVPLESIVPRRYRCQPDLAVTEAITAADKPKGSLTVPERLAITAGVQARVRPAFTNLRYGQPGYGQLGAFATREIRTGAEDESEMGVFHDVFGPQRESNLRIRLEEYLRFGLEAGIFYAT